MRFAIAGTSAISGFASFHPPFHHSRSEFALQLFDYTCTAVSYESCDAFDGLVPKFEAGSLQLLQFLNQFGSFFV